MRCVEYVYTWFIFEFLILLRSLFVARENNAPLGSTKSDWEVELAVVIGKKASYVQESEAMDYVAGYMVHNDISERAFQLEMEGQWVKGKSCDTFAPLGPFMATKEEIAELFPN